MNADTPNITTRPAELSVLLLPGDGDRFALVLSNWTTPISTAERLALEKFAEGVGAAGFVTFSSWLVVR